MSLAASSFSSGLLRFLQYSKTSRFLYVLPVSKLRGLVIGDAKEVSWEEDFCTGVVRICAWEMAEVEEVEVVIVVAVIEAGVVEEETVETGLVAWLLALVNAVVVTGLALVSVLVFTVLLTLFSAP